jgi:hypothetical protein
MHNLTEILTEFEPITLDGMDNVRLMDRMDSKYVFHRSKLPEILNLLKHDYTILEVSGHRLNQYKTLYYDTDDFTMYHHHLHGKSNRDKIRFRTYVCSDHHFFEIKNKNNKDLTRKKRIRCKEEIHTIEGQKESFLEEGTEFKSHHLSPKLWVLYSRITLVNKSMTERLTIDVDLHYEFEDQSRSLPDIIIAELKYSKSCHSGFTALMHKEHIREASFSKYCFGIIFLHPELKHNRFKPHLLKLNKICHGTI